MTAVGIVFFEGRTWFVNGALAGEEVEARVLGAHGKVVEARTERVFKPSELRRPAPCAHFGRCGGCSVQHLPHAEQLALKQRMLAEQLSRVAGVEPQAWAAPLSGPELGYRRRAPRGGALGRQGQDPGSGLSRRGQPGHRRHLTIARCWYRPCNRSCSVCPTCCGA